MDNDKTFDPEELQRIVDRLREEGRLPSAEEFVKAALEVRRRFKKNGASGRTSRQPQ